VTLVQYSSDVRIKEDIESVDEDALLQRIKAIRVRSYGYTDEWRQVRDDVPNARVRGIIAQELAEVDTAILTDELPPNAYTDAGFAQFLKASARD
jgi:hypothetical protein